MEMLIVERYDDGKWVDTDMESLKEGDIFRLFESVDEPVEDDDGCTTWVCTCDAYLMDGEPHGLDEDVFGVECDPVEV